jgi:hypothetical protein
MDTSVGRRGRGGRNVRGPGRRFGSAHPCRLVLRAQRRLLPRRLPHAGGAYYFDFDTFSFRGSLQVCVVKRTEVCRVRPLIGVGRGLYRARIYWAINYPNQGPGRYAVSWYAQGRRIGRTLYFTL